MTNPGGIKPPSRNEDMAPLFPRHHLQPTDDPQRLRDLQVWPRHMRENHERQELRRTAGVKHHLRSMAGRNDMLSTYEHDFGIMTRPNPKGQSTGFAPSFYGTGGKPPANMNRSGSLSLPVSPTKSRIAAPRPWDVASGHSSEDDDVRSTRSNRSNRSKSLVELGVTARDPGATLGYSTFSKMNAMCAGGGPMRLTVNGWGDQRWSPYSHPSMVTGFSDKRCGLEQITKISNLRAPDIPFCTR